MRPNKLIVMMSIAAVLIAAALPVLAAQPQASSAHGQLTAVEDRNTSVIIDDRGYILSPKALIYDQFGKKSSIGDLELPVPVYIEFQYAPQGAVINLLKVTPR